MKPNYECLNTFESNKWCYTVKKPLETNRSSVSNSGKCDKALLQI